MEDRINILRWKPSVLALFSFEGGESSPLFFLFSHAFPHPTADSQWVVVLCGKERWTVRTKYTGQSGLMDEVSFPVDLQITKAFLWAKGAYFRIQKLPVRKGQLLSIF